MKTQIVSLSLLILLAAACSGDDNAATDGGPQNKPDTSVSDTGNNMDTGMMMTDSGGQDSGPNVCANGVVFDNTRIPGWPTVPQVP